jgi:hypothetical protein
MDTIIEKANTQIEFFNQATTDLDMSEFMAPDTANKMNHFPMKEQFASESSLLLPQFMLRVEHNNLFGDSDDKKILEKEDCLS